MAVWEREPGDGPPVAESRSSLGPPLKRLLQRVRHTEGSLQVPTIAKDLHISQASVYAYLSGKTLPPVDRLDDLLSKLGASALERRWFHDLRDDVELRFPARPKPDPVDSGPPIIEVMLPDGTMEVADVREAASTPPEQLDLSGAYRIEGLVERVHVDARRTFPRVDYWRSIRGLEPGVQRFSYEVEFPPDSGLRRVMIEPHGQAAISDVIRVARSAYIVHFHLGEPLKLGEVGELSFSLFTVEDEKHESIDIYGKRQFVATEKALLSVEFADAARPAQVRWFVAPFPLGNFPDGFDFPAENIVEPDLDGRYERSFSQVPEGRIFGLMWEYT